MPDDRDDRNLLEDEPEVTYEPLPQQPEQRTSGASSRWLAGGAAAGGIFGAGGSAIGKLRGSLDIFDSADAAEREHADTGEPETEMDPIDFDTEPALPPTQESVADVIHGAESEVGGGFTLEEFEALDLPAAPDDFGQSDGVLPEDQDDDDPDIP